MGLYKVNSLIDAGLLSYSGLYSMSANQIQGLELFKIILNFRMLQFDQSEPEPG